MNVAINYYLYIFSYTMFVSPLCMYLSYCIIIIYLSICRTIDGQNQSLIILNAILLTERAITKEIALLMELRVYPSMELAIIRKEIKSFKDHQDYILCKMMVVMMTIMMMIIIMMIMMMMNTQ